MSESLSFGAIARTLVALGATGVVACGGANPPADNPVEAKEVPGATATGDAPKDKAAGCGAAGGCGHKAGAAGQAGCGASGQAGCGAGGASGAEAGAAASAAGSAGAAAQPAAVKAPAKKKHAGAAGGCGAGTCG